MNFNIGVKCDTCGADTHCRLGLSNRRIQPLRFCCSNCSAPIDMTIVCDFEEVKVDVQITGAKRIDDSLIFRAENFVDLHLDFPVSFDKYVMGKTPFLLAAMRIGHESMQTHQVRLSYLNEMSEQHKEIKTLITLYLSGNKQLFKSKVLAFLGGDAPCDLQIDQNRALYFALEKAFFSFSEPERNYEAVKDFCSKLFVEGKNYEAPLELFVDEIVSSEFLKNCQRDCLEVYPRILDAEFILRPALFLDFDTTQEADRIPFRISASDFTEFKDLYKDITEILSRLLVLVAGLNNIRKRGSHNAFLVTRRTPSSLSSFADKPLGLKLDYIDDSWYPIEMSVMDNGLRNAVAHYKIEYDDVSQVLTYYPRREGLSQTDQRNMTFLDFSRRILQAFREMHRLHHLVKCIFIYHYSHSPSEND